MRAVIILITLFSIVSCGGKKKKITANSTNTNRPSTMKVDGYVVRPQSYGESIEVPGSVIANEVTEVHPETSGRLVYLNVAEGKYVGKGTLLAKLYDGDLQAQLKKIQIQLSIASKTEERQSQLLKIQGISQQDYDLSLLQVHNLQADIDIIRTSISKTEIRAPFSGRLGLKNISPGAYVTPVNVIAVINQTDQLKLDFTVPEKYAGQIKIGQLVTFSYEGSNKKYLAKVSATESSVAENTRSLTVRSIVQAKDASLLPGAFAKVELNFEPDANALLVPTQAILPQARGKKIIVYKGGSIQFVDIETSSRDSARIQVTEGLSAGDTIVVTGLLSLRPESKVEIGRIINN
jgi:membrane fusion protein (multidrug efflux system)